MLIPDTILQRLYTFGSLQNVDTGVQFSLKNRLSDAVVTDITAVRIGEETIPKERLWLSTGNGRMAAGGVSAENPLNFPLRQSVEIYIDQLPLPLGQHDLEIAFETQPFGQLKIAVEDEVATVSKLPRIPRDEADDYSEEIIQSRRDFVHAYTGVKLDHVAKPSFDPHLVAGNNENFIGVAQVPIGIAGPITVHGEHADGDFIVPLAATEGTLVASYNRGIKVLNLSGGIKATVVDDRMQRAPVFVFDDARGARDFAGWIDSRMPEIRTIAQSTSSVAQLLNIEHFLSNKFIFLRFNFYTGDAAGQNMVGKATFEACKWMIDAYDGEYPMRHFYLESNLATDKKHSQINLMRTRGKRVTAEAIIKRDVLYQHMRVLPEQLNYHGHIANVGALISGVNNNGLHSVNAITAMFIATGQDVANVAESSSALIFSEITPEKDLYFSITLPSLIVATYGGGTGLATQNECLAMMDCVGSGKVNKFAEIVASVVLAGEVSLAAAISSSDWVSSHEHFGRNR